VLVAFPGGADKMGGIPTVDLFDQVDDLPVRRILLRGLTVPESGPHEFGTSVEEIAERLHALIECHTRVIFTGASIGGFLALLLGTMLRADALILFGPTTSLDPEFLRSVGDHRYDGSPFLQDPEWVARFADPTRLWETQRPPKIVLHFGYRNESTRPHAERLASFPNVTLNPHYERTLMAKIRDDGTLRRDLRHALLG
jgi:hypothetical protein